MNATFSLIRNAVVCCGIVLFAARPIVPAVADDKTFLQLPAHAAIYDYQYQYKYYQLDPGPHLLIDWRYVYPGKTLYKYQGHGIKRDRPAKYSSEINPKIEVDPKNAPSGIRIEMVKSEKLGPVVKNDKPWEFFTPYVNLIHHGGKYMLFYNTTTFKTKRSYVVCYAESTDGLHYAKPELGLVEFEGSKANNIVLGPGVCKYGIHGQGVFVDPHAPPEERFKALYQAQAAATPEVIAKLKAQRPQSVSYSGEKNPAAIMGAVSPDGIHWRELEEPLLAHVSDTGTTAYWDERLQRYVGYFRTYLMGRRAIARAETTDFRRWPRPEMILWPQPSDEAFVDYYTNGHSLYPGTQTMHLMFPMIYKRNIDTSVMRTASSVDGRVWGFLPGKNSLEPGKEGEFDGGCIFPGAGLAEIPGDRVVLPYCGFAVPHKAPRLGPLGEIALAVWHKERISALVADEEGYFVTIPLKSQGRTLWLNFDTPRNGSVVVEVEGVPGHRLQDCDPLFGNHLKKQVTWNGKADLGVESGKEFTLRFRLKAAKLYSFEIK